MNQNLERTSSRLTWVAVFFGILLAAVALVSFAWGFETVGPAVERLLGR